MHFFSQLLKYFLIKEVTNRIVDKEKTLATVIRETVKTVKSRDISLNFTSFIRTRRITSNSIVQLLPVKLRVTVDQVKLGL